MTRQPGQQIISASDQVDWQAWHIDNRREQVGFRFRRAHEVKLGLLTITRAQAIKLG